MDAERLERRGLGELDVGLGEGAAASKDLVICLADFGVVGRSLLSIAEAALLGLGDLETEESRFFELGRFGDLLPPAELRRDGVLGDLE